MLSKRFIKMLKLLKSNEIIVPDGKQFDSSDFVDLLEFGYAVRLDVTLPHSLNVYPETVFGYQITKMGLDALELHFKEKLITSITIAVGATTLLLSLIQLIISISL